MPNLIVILFSILYPVFIVGFNCKGCVWEREYEDFSKLKTEEFSLVARRISRNDACALHMTGMWRVNTMETVVFRDLLAGKAFPQDTCKTFYFAKLSNLIHTFCTHIIYIHITHKCWEVLLRENLSHKSWELEIVISTYLYTFVCGFFSTPTSPFPYHWEVYSPNTYHTISECQVRIWCRWKVLEEARFWQMQSGVLRDPES